MIEITEDKKEEKKEEPKTSIWDKLAEYKEELEEKKEEAKNEEVIEVKGKKKIEVVKELLEKGYNATQIAELTGYDKNYVYVTCSKLKKSLQKSPEAEKITGIEIEKKTIPKPKPRVKVEERILTEDELKQLFLSVNPMFRQFGLEEVSETEASLLANLWRPYATITGDVGLALAVGTTSLIFGGRILKKVIDRRKEERKEQKQIEQVEEKIISGGDGKSWFERRRGSI